MNYRLKSTLVEAKMWDGHNDSEIEEFLGNSFRGCGNNLVAHKNPSEQYKSKLIFFKDSQYGCGRSCYVGDYFIKDSQGKIYCFDPKMFEDLFEVVDGD